MTTEKGYYSRVHQRLLTEFFPFQQGKTFTAENIYAFFDLGKYRLEKSQEIKHAISEVLWNLSQKNKDKLLQLDANNRYRLVDKTLDEVEWWVEPEEGVVECPLRLPLGLNGYCVLDTPCLIVVASPTNQGKTALLLNILNLNLETYKDNIFLFESDPIEQIKRRFKHFPFPIPIPPPFKMYRRLMNFEDVIEPAGLNLIDYVRVDTQKIWAVQDTMLKLLSKLTTGIAVVALQKPPGRDLAYGKDFSAFDSSLYLSIDKGKVRFVKIKTPKLQEDGIDPYSIAIQYKLRYGVQYYDEMVVSIDE